MRLGLAALAALLLTGCSSAAPSPLRATDFAPPDGASDAGLRRPSWSPTKGVPSFRSALRDGQEVTFGMTLRNTGSDRVVVDGVGADPDVDGYLRPRSMSPARVTLGAGESRAVRIRASASCGDSAPGQLRYKQAQLLRVGGDERQVRFGAILLATCA